MGDSQQWPGAGETPFWQPYVRQVATAAEITVTAAPQIPDGWLVVVHPASGAAVDVFPGPAASGVGIRIGGGGFAKLISNGDSISVRGIGATTATVTFIAIRGDYIRWVSYDPGELA